MNEPEPPEAVKRVAKEIKNQYGIIEVSEPEHDGLDGWDIEVKTKYQPEVPNTLKDAEISLVDEEGRVSLLGNRRGINIMVKYEEVQPQ